MATERPTTPDGSAPGVAVLGGGIGGLTAAHELALRGFDVTVYEAAPDFGGKARSLHAPAAGGVSLPGEHGFRFFPGFYRHVVETMGRIPLDGGRVSDHLVPTEATLVAGAKGPPMRAETGKPGSVSEWFAAVRPDIGGGRVPDHEVRFFLRRLLVLFTSGERRRREQWEHTSWWEFIRAEEMSPAYRKYLARATQALVALRPKLASARSMGLTYLQLLRGRVDPALEPERVLDGPTSAVWIGPWIDHLASLGVGLEADHRVTGLDVADGRVVGVEFAADAPTERIEPGHVVSALPAEVMASLVTPAVERLDRSLAGIDRLETAWMNGLQFYLAEDVPLVRGHSVLTDSPWALTAISQRQFWEAGPYDLAGRGDGRVEGVLSVIVSDWETPGSLVEKPARACTPAELREEVWAQLRRHLETPERQLDEGLVVDWFLDPAIVETDDGLENASPLFVNTVGSLGNRPEAGTGIDNLVLAADYVRTSTDLASMEGANEAGRRAVNALLERTGSTATPCAVWDLREPAVFAPLKRQDDLAHRMGLPHPGEAETALRGIVERLRP